MPTVGFSQVFNDGQTVNVIGVKLYYADGTVATVAVPTPPLNPAKLNQIRDSWLLAQAIGIQCVNIYFDREYQFHVGGGVLATKRYKKTLTQFENYWFSPSQGFGASNVLPSGPVDAVDTSMPPLDAIIKTGTEIAEDSFKAIWNTAFEDRIF